MLRCLKHETDLDTHISIQSSVYIDPPLALSLIQFIVAFVGSAARLWLQREQCECKSKAPWCLCVCVRASDSGSLVPVGWPCPSPACEPRLGLWYTRARMCACLQHRTIARATSSTQPCAMRRDQKPVRRTIVELSNEVSLARD